MRFLHQFSVFSISFFYLYFYLVTWPVTDSRQSPFDRFIITLWRDQYFDGPKWKSVFSWGFLSSYSNSFFSLWVSCPVNWKGFVSILQLPLLVLWNKVKKQQQDQQLINFFSGKTDKNKLYHIFHFWFCLYCHFIKHLLSIIKQYIIYYIQYLILALSK